MRRSSGLKEAWTTHPRWRMGGAAGDPSLAFQTRASWSLEAVTIYLSLGLKTADLILAVWPIREYKSSPVCASQTRATPSLPADTNWSPLWLNCAEAICAELVRRSSRVPVLQSQIEIV